jgi:hypothetical protein
MQNGPSIRTVSAARFRHVACVAFLLVGATLAQSPFESGLVFDPLTVIQPARPGSGSAFKDLVIGRATRPLVVAALGAPTSSTGPVEQWLDSADCRRFALQSITVRFDTRGVLDQIHLVLAAPLLPGAVAAALSLGQPTEIRPNGAQEIRLFAPAGIGMGITAGQVDALWLINASAGPPTPEPGPAALGPPPLDTPWPPPAAAPPALPRLLAIQNVVIETQSLWNNEPALQVSATVRATQFESRPIRLEVRLRDRQGRMIPAPPGWPPEFSDGANLRLAAYDQLRFADATWSPWVYIPYRALPSPAPGEPWVVSVLAVCGGYGALSESLAVPGAPLGPTACVRLTGVQLCTTQGPDPLACPAGSDPFTTEPGQPPEPGAIVSAEVQTEALAAPLVLTLQLRQPGGEPVRAAPTAPYAERSAEGRWIRQTTTPVGHGPAYWPGLQAAIPYHSLDLPPGLHHLILNYTAEAAGLRAFAETEITLPIPERGQAAPPLHNTPGGDQGSEAAQVQSVALEFLAAANRGDVATLRTLGAETLVDRMEAQLAGRTQTDRVERQVRKLKCDNNHARAEVWMKNPEVTNLYAELLAAVDLERSAAGWRVSRFSVTPYLRELDVEKRP